MSILSALRTNGTVDLDQLEADSLPWVRAMQECMQGPTHHPEGVIRGVVRCLMSMFLTRGLAHG